MVTICNATARATSLPRADGRKWLLPANLLRNTFRVTRNPARRECTIHDVHEGMLGMMRFASQAIRRLLLPATLAAACARPGAEPPVVRPAVATPAATTPQRRYRSEEHTSELQSPCNLV